MYNQRLTTLYPQVQQGLSGQMFPHASQAIFFNFCSPRVPSPAPLQKPVESKQLNKRDIRGTRLFGPRGGQQEERFTLPRTCPLRPVLAKVFSTSGWPASPGNK